MKLNALLRWTALLTLAGAFALAALLQAIFILVQFGFSYLPVLILGSLLLALMAVFVHESGHLMAALAAGFRVRRLVAGPVEMVRRIRRSRVPWGSSMRSGMAEVFPSTSTGEM